ncbi:MAG: hypothetical protein EXS08_15765 [Planctomycetes bacterium]|nr:hypothetical protein [Planctomycetota bacterium]
MRLRALLAIVLVLPCLGCGEPGAPPAAARAPSTLVRLWTQDGTLSERAPPPAAEARFTSRFAEGLDGWGKIDRPGRANGALQATLEREDERAFLRLTGEHGGLYARVPVEPGACYEFTGLVRATALEVAGTTFGGASFWLGEARAEVPLAELLSTRGAELAAVHGLASARGTEGWQARRKLFVTGKDTHFLYVVCSLAVEESVRSGAADFAELGLGRVAPELRWLELLSAQTATLAPTSPAWQRARRVRALLGMESRPSIVLLPGDRLRLSWPAFAERATLRFGLGAFAPTLPAGGGSATLSVRARGRELAARTLTLPRSVDELDWQEVELALERGLTELEFELAGDAPLVLGAPLVAADVPRPAGPNVLLISIDTLRADHVGAYGAAQATPTLDALARRGLLCRDASAPAPYTLPSHATLLTGQQPAVHGVVAHDRRLSAARSTSLAEVLADAGYVTRAFTSGGFVSAEFGLDHGFDGFAQIDPLRERESHYFRTLTKRRGPKTAEKLLQSQGFAGVERWLSAHRDERFFLFLHTYAVHDYDAPARYLECAALGCTRPQVALSTRTSAQAAAFTPEMRAHVVHLYDAALRYTDERLGALLALLDGLQLTDDTLVLVTADHGEEFFEHGALQHGRTLYEEVLRVPLILAGPGVPARELTRPALLADAAPTLLARLGLAFEHAQGVDLLGADWPRRPLWAEVDDRFAHKYALRTEDGIKTIHGPTTSAVMFTNEREWERFDLGADPREQHDLATAGAAALSAAQQELVRTRAALEELGEHLGALELGQVDARTLDDLEDLGYGGLEK